MGYQESVNLTELTEAYLDEEARQSLMKYATAAARNADAALSAVCREGMVSYQDDTNSLIVQRTTTLANISTIGPVHGAASVWVPVITQSNAPTFTTTYATYTRLGRRIFYEFLLVLTGTGTAANNVTVTLPVASAQSNGNSVLGGGYLYDNSATTPYSFEAVISTTSTIRLKTINQGGALTYLGVTQFTAALAVNDVISCSGHYEAAADA